MVDIITLTGPAAINTICNRDCKFKITCSGCRHEDFYISEHTEDDQGWNPVEGKLFLKFNCTNCTQVINKDLVWNKQKHKKTIQNKI